MRINDVWQKGLFVADEPVELIQELAPAAGYADGRDNSLA
jgi:hypothetical protein